MMLLGDSTLDTQEYQANLKSLLFLCGFVLLCIAVTIWWLRR
jgi:hypothetical protein